MKKNLRDAHLISLALSKSLTAMNCCKAVQASLAYLMNPALVCMISVEEDVWAESIQSQTIEIRCGGNKQKKICLSLNIGENRDKEIEKEQIFNNRYLFDKQVAITINDRQGDPVTKISQGTEVLILIDCTSSID